LPETRQDDRASYKATEMIALGTNDRKRIAGFRYTFKGDEDVGKLIRDLPSISATVSSQVMKFVCFLHLYSLV